jgi:hypothetical protein
MYGILCWEYSDVDVFRCPDEVFHRSAKDAIPPTVAHSVRQKDLGNAVGPSKLHDGIRRVFSIQGFDSRAGSPPLRKVFL